MGQLITADQISSHAQLSRLALHAQNNNYSAMYDLGLRVHLLCSKFYLFLPALPKKFTHYSYFMLLSSPIILIKFFLAILHAGSSGVARQEVSVNEYCERNSHNWTTDCSIRI